jgi:hypothetical protein
MFCSIFMEILAPWYLAALLTVRYVSPAWAAHFRIQKGVKDVQMTFGVCYGFVLFVFKDVTSDGDGICYNTPHHTTPYRYRGGIEKRMWHLGRMFLRAVAKVLRSHISRKVKMVFIRNLFVYNVWDCAVWGKKKHQLHKQDISALATVRFGVVCQKKNNNLC